MTDEPDPKPAPIPPPGKVVGDHDPGWNSGPPYGPGAVEPDVDRDGYPTTLETEKVLENRADDQP